MSAGASVRTGQIVMSSAKELGSWEGNAFLPSFNFVAAKSDRITKLSTAFDNNNIEFIWLSEPVQLRHFLFTSWFSK